MSAPRTKASAEPPMEPFGNACEQSRAGRLSHGVESQASRFKERQRKLETIEEESRLSPASREAKGSFGCSGSIRRAVTPERLCPGQETEDVLSGLPLEAARRLPEQARQALVFLPVERSHCDADRDSEEASQFPDDECPMPRFLWSAYRERSSGKVQ
eukprot:TRINITY_DN29060_c0_g2_i1.p1 TRINITY_DN29060_c0_g2~~TRINITY_DN29060_c0_g2_i1.p1  ORF type:complete len:158 (-),score=19.71 TRINITY_DN29060_c0_g2_i1:57-530(-)